MEKNYIAKNIPVRHTAVLHLSKCLEHSDLKNGLGQPKYRIIKLSSNFNLWLPHKMLGIQIIIGLLHESVCADVKTFLNNDPHS